MTGTCKYLVVPSSSNMQDYIYTVRMVRSDLTPGTAHFMLLLCWFKTFSVHSRYQKHQWCIFFSMARSSFKYHWLCLCDHVSVVLKVTAFLKCFVNTVTSLVVVTLFYTTRGSLLTRSLADIVKKDDFVLDSEYLITLLAVVPKWASLFSQDYDHVFMQRIKL